MKLCHRTTRHSYSLIKVINTLADKNNKGRIAELKFLGGIPNLSECKTLTHATCLLIPFSVLILNLDCPGDQSLDFLYMYSPGDLAKFQGLKSCKLVNSGLTAFLNTPSSYIQLRILHFHTCIQKIY